jgi:phosphoribosylamine--glycine ligase
MGAFAPSPLVTAGLQERIEREIVRPVLTGMAAEGAPFRGFLYCGLMITDEGPKVIEFNVRFGDPEAQVVLPLLEAPLAPMLMAAADGALAGVGPPPRGDDRAERRPGLAGAAAPGAAKAESRESGVGTALVNKAIGVVLATAGYPGETRLGDAVGGLDALSRECPEALAFFAGVQARDNSLITSGGRVMTIVARGTTFERAIAGAYRAVEQVRFEGMQFRRDIGRKAMR